MAHEPKPLVCTNEVLFHTAPLFAVYGRIGKFDLALQEFNEAIRIDRDYADAHYNLGVLLEFLEEEELAKKEFEIAVSLEPTNQLYVKRLKLLE